MSSSTRLSFLGPYPLGYGLALIVMCGTIFFGYLSAPNAGIAGALGGCASALSALGLSRSRITLLAVALLLAVAQEENSLDSLIGLVYMLGAYLVMRGVSVTNSVVAASAALLPPFESALLNVLTAFATAILVPIPPLLHPSKKTQARFLGFIAALCVTAAVITATARLADARANASLITAAGLAVGAVFLGWCIERVPSSVGVQPLQLAVSGVYAGQIEIQLILSIILTVILTPLSFRIAAHIESRLELPSLIHATPFILPFRGSLIRAALGTALGATAGATALGLFEVLLASLPLVSARARRGATLDLCALICLFTGGIAILVAASPKVAAARAVLSSFLAASGAPAAAAAALLPGGTLLAAKGARALSGAVSAAALLLPTCLLLDAISRRSLLFVPLLANVTVRGNPISPAPAAALTFEWYAGDDSAGAAGEEDEEEEKEGGGDENNGKKGEKSTKSKTAKSTKSKTATVTVTAAASTDAASVKSLLSLLNRNQTTATFFMRPQDATSPDGLALVTAILGAGCEVGLLGGDSPLTVQSDAKALAAVLAQAASDMGSSPTPAATQKASATPRKRSASPASNAPVKNAVASSSATQTTLLKWFRPSRGASDVWIMAAATRNGLMCSLATCGGASLDDALASSAYKSSGTLNGATFVLPAPFPQVLCSAGGAVEQLLACFSKAAGAYPQSLSTLLNGKWQEEEAINRDAK